MKVAIVWSRFGPYHLARLRGAAKYAQRIGADVVGVEVAPDDDDYDWEVCSGANGFERYTVFPAKSYNSLSPRKIRGKVAGALKLIEPHAVAINGWSVPEAQSALKWCDSQPDRAAILMTETKQDDSKRVWWKESIKKRLLSRYCAALVGGRKQAEYLRKLGFGDHCIFAGYDVVDNDYFAVGAARVRADADFRRRQAGLPDHYFFACTRFLARKNLDGLLRAYAAYRARYKGTPWGLVIAGGGEAESVLRQLEASLGVQGVVWSGFLQYEQLPVYYGLAAAFVHPAKSEPWGLVVNEAAASGLPVLVSHTVGSRYELVRDGVNGYLFDPFDIEAISRVLLSISEAPENVRARMGALSVRLVRQWTPEFFGRQLFAAVSRAQAQMEPAA